MPQLFSALRVLGRHTVMKSALEVGSRLGHYEVTALIGEGGMGQVWQATDTKLNRQVALETQADESESESSK